MHKPKRVAVIGLDCAITSLIDKHIADGYLPTFKRLFEGGVVADNCLVPYPTVTPPNWATIATGALIGTHQVTDFWVHVLGTTPENLNAVQAFGSKHCQADYLWDVADRESKRCIVLNYPTAWPSQMKNGLMVGGAGTEPSQNRAGIPGISSFYSLCANQAITTGFYPGAIRGEFKVAHGWQDVDEPGANPLEMAARLTFPHADGPIAPTTWYVLARQSEGNGYDRLTLSPSRDFNDAFCTLAVGQWSPKIWAKIKMQDGTVREVFFRCKLMELSKDAADFRLFLTGLIDLSPFCSPASLAAKIVSPEGVPVPGDGFSDYSLGIIDADTFAECCAMHSQWVGDAAVSLFKEAGDWDLFFMHCHPPDHVYHALMTDLTAETCSEAERRAKAWDTDRKMYESVDRMVAQVVEAAGEDTLVILVSDHGACADGPAPDLYKIMGEAGLTTLCQEEGRTNLAGRLAELERMSGLLKRPDPARSKALPQRGSYVYVNLKGRDPEGVVEAEDYEKVQQEIIDALLTYRDPESGKRPIALALSKRDARVLGLYGEQVGDVVYAVYPWFGNQHGHILPNARWGIGDLRGLWVLYGPGIKRGVRLERTIGLEDLVPTICYLMDWPLPGTVDGAVIYQAFNDPNFKRNEVAKLKDGLARMEEALDRTHREPWEKYFVK